MARRVVIGASDWQRSKSSLRRLARALDAGRRVAEADYELNFAQTGDLLAQITNERLRLLSILRTSGPSTIYALAKRLGRKVEHLLSAAPVDKRGQVALAAMDRYVRLTLDPDGRAAVPINLVSHLDALKSEVIRVVMRDSRLWLWSEERWQAERIARRELLS